MRILDDDHGVSIRTVSLYLTRDECVRLIERLLGLIDKPGSHFHFNDEAMRELSASIYDEAAVARGEVSHYNALERTMFKDG